MLGAVAMRGSLTRMACTTTLRPSALLLPSAGKVSLSSPCQTHTFHASARRHASVNDEADGLMEKLKQSPSALEAVKKFIGILEKKGVDPKQGPPGMMQLAKLAMDSDVRSATGDVLTALKDAGVNVSQENMMAALQHFNNSGDKKNEKK